MSEVTTKKDRFIGGLMKMSVTDFDSDQQAIREAALHALQQLEFPTLRDEHWKYTRISSVLKDNYEPKEVDLDQANYGVAGEVSARLVFVNGFYNTKLSEINDVDQVDVLTLAQARVEMADLLGDYYAKMSDHEGDIFHALNTAFNHTGVVVRVAPGVVLDKPIHIVNQTVGEGAAVQPRNLFVVGDGGELSMIHEFVGDGGSSFSNVLSEIYVGDKAKCDYRILQDGGDGARAIQNTEVIQGESSVFSTGVYTFSGLLIRNNLNIRVQGEHCETNLSGIYLLHGREHVDNHTVVDHLVPNCESNENYKGIVDDKATAVFNGKVFVRPDAQKIQAFQNNQNILLSDTASVNSKPELEIYADDVKCSHGSTTGQIDEDAMFYLMARGVKPEEARKLLVNAFVADITEEIPHEEMRDLVQLYVNQKMNK